MGRLTKKIVGLPFIFLPKNFTKKFLKFWDKVGKFSLLKLYSILRGKEKNLERMNYICISNKIPTATNLNHSRNFPALNILTF
jgi:hypothetical protein